MWQCEGEMGDGRMIAIVAVDANDLNEAASLSGRWWLLGRLRRKCLQAEIGPSQSVRALQRRVRRADS